ncbi:unnamed protein product [Paramecium octaurelia]|uniref:Uncharacterized protein n=1 Tax=Paramecium octaurelia TaxID=43137 RepID=A0A8S1S9H6_PAROT|nr:unnamed protein product [Paramecium octaurelia]
MVQVLSKQQQPNLKSQFSNFQHRQDEGGVDGAEQSIGDYIILNIHQHCQVNTFKMQHQLFEYTQLQYKLETQSWRVVSNSHLFVDIFQQRLFLNQHIISECKHTYQLTPGESHLVIGVSVSNSKIHAFYLPQHFYKELQKVHDQVSYLNQSHDQLVCCRSHTWVTYSSDVILPISKLNEYPASKEQEDLELRQPYLLRVEQVDEYSGA